MNFVVVPAHKVSLTEQAETFTDAFAGYLAGSRSMDADAVTQFLCAQGIDLCYSRFLMNKGKPIAFGYVNRTGGIPRLAGMGTVPGVRRTGAATALLSHLLEEAKERGDQAMVLEVFEQNEPALKLYRGQGFRELTRLFGWRRSSSAGKASAADLQEISLLAAMQLPGGSEYPELPWQISRHAVAKLSACRAFWADNSAIVTAAPSAAPTRIHAFFGWDSLDWKRLRNITAALLEKFPECEFFAPAIFPEQFGDEIFGPLGFHKEELNQFLMRRDL